MSTAATELKVLLLVPAAVNTSAFALAVLMVPRALDNVTVPVLTAATVPASVKVLPAKVMESLPAVAFAKAPMPMLRPSKVESVMDDLLPAVVNAAVIPVAL